MANIPQKSSEIVKAFLRKHPSVHECFRAGLINLTALSRLIITEEKAENTNAVLMALSRLQRRMPIKTLKDKRFLQLLKKARIIVRTGLCLIALSIKKNDPRIAKVIAKINAEGRDLHIIEGVEYVTIITSEEFKDLLQSSFKGSIQSFHKDAAQVSVIMHPSTQLMPGITAFVCGLIAEQGINIFEIVTTFGEDMFVIDRNDLEAVLVAIKH